VARRLEDLVLSYGNTEFGTVEDETAAARDRRGVSGDECLGQGKGSPAGKGR